MSFRGLWKARRPVSSTGAGLLAFLLASTALGGCVGSSADTGDPLADEAEALGLPSGANLHRVTLGGRGAEEHAVPTRIPIEPGDAVEFWTVDHRVHTLRFVLDSLRPEARQFLEASDQLASPPLVNRGSRFIVRFDEAPRGRYLFESQGHGGVARGVVEVGVVEVDSTAGEEGP